MEPRNFLKLERFSFCHRFYAYLDSIDYLADGLFIKHQVRVKFLQEYEKVGSAYRMVFCKVRKQDAPAFLKAVQELPNKMLLCGYPDYPDECKQLMETIFSGINE